MNPTIDQMKQLTDRLIELGGDAARDTEILSMGEFNKRPAVWIETPDEHMPTCFTFVGDVILCNGDSRW